jgi:hypothetical protein
VSRRRLLLNGRLFAVHHLANLHRRQGCTVTYAQGILLRSTLCAVEGNIFYITVDRTPYTLIVPSIDLLTGLFQNRNRERRSIYIRSDGTPGRIFNFWDYQDAWPG